MQSHLVNELTNSLIYFLACICENQCEKSLLTFCLDQSSAPKNDTRQRAPQPARGKSPKSLTVHMFISGDRAPDHVHAAHGARRKAGREDGAPRGTAPLHRVRVSASHTRLRLCLKNRTAKSFALERRQCRRGTQTFHKLRFLPRGKCPSQHTKFSRLSSESDPTKEFPPLLLTVLQ